MGMGNDTEMELVGTLAMLRAQLADIREALTRGEDWGSVDRIERLEWAAGGFVDYDYGGVFFGVALFNRSENTAYVGFGPGRGRQGSELVELPGRSFRILPVRDTFVSIGGPYAGVCEVVFFTVPPAPGAGVGTIALAPGQGRTLATNRIQVGGAGLNAIVGAQGALLRVKCTCVVLTLAAGVTGQFRSGANDITGTILDPGCSSSGQASSPVLVCGLNEALNLNTVGGGAQGWVTWFAEP